MTKTDQLIALLQSGPKLPSEVRAAIPRLGIKLMNNEVKRGTIKVTDGFFHLPEVSDGTLAEKVEALGKRVTKLEKQLKK